MACTVEVEEHQTDIYHELIKGNGEAGVSGCVTLIQHRCRVFDEIELIGGGDPSGLQRIQTSEAWRVI